jgi:hypothetical protein
MDRTNALYGVRHALVGCGIVAGLTLTSLAAQPASNLDAPATTSALQSFLDRQASAKQYNAVRHLEASGSGQRGWMHVQTDFTATSGMAYTVTREGGSGMIRGRILRSLLDEERQLIASGTTGAVAISPANYELTVEGADEHGLTIVSMRPLRKERSLIAGRMFLEADGSLVRIVGRLAKNPSFWVSRVNVTREYRRINGIVMPVSLATTAQLRLFGSASMQMTYRYSLIDEKPVEGLEVE